MGGKRNGRSAQSQKKRGLKLPRGIQIRKNKKKHDTLQIFFSFRGVECRESINLAPTSANIRYAERLRSEIINAIERGVFRYTDYFPDSKRAAIFGHSVSTVTIGQLLDDFLAHSQRTLSPSTYLGYQKICVAHLYPQFKHVRIRDLTPELLRTWIGNLDLSAKRIRNILTPLRHVIDQAMVDGYIDRNPLSAVPINKLIARDRRASRFEVDPFDEDEINAILEACRHPQHKNLIQLAFYTGLRTSELIALQWGDIDWLKGTIHICRATVAGIDKPPKTKAGRRDIILLPEARAALESQKQWTWLAGEYVFHDPGTDRRWGGDDRIRRKAWEPALKKSGVRWRNPYQTRHTYAIRLLANGENLWWVASQLGHRGIEMLLRHYAKWIPKSIHDMGIKSNLNLTKKSKN